MKGVDVLEIAEKIAESGIDIKKVKEQLREIEEKIEKKREEIRKLEEKREKIIQELPEEVREFFGKKKRNGGKRKYRVIAPDGRELSVRDAYYEIYPEREGKSYKYEDMIKALEKNGYRVEVEE